MPDSIRPAVTRHTLTERIANKRWIPTFATLLSSTLGNILTVVGTALLVRLLGGEAFGRAALLTSAAITLGTVTSSGVCLYILRATARSGRESTIGAQLWIGTFVGQGLAALITISILLGGASQTERSLLEYLLIGLTLHFTTSDALSKNRLIGAQRLMPLAAATVCGSIGSMALQLIGAQVGGPMGYTIGFATGTGLQAAASWLACKRNLAPMGPIPQGIFKRLRDVDFIELVAMGTLSACIVPLAHWLNTLIAAHKTADYGEVATLTVAMQFFNMVIFVPTILNKIILPKTIKEDAGRHVDESRRDAYRQSLKMVLHTAPMLLVVWLFSGPIAAIYRFTSHDGITVIMCFVGASVLACAAIPLSNYFVSHSRMKQGLLGNAAWAAAYLGLAMTIPGGAIGAAVSLLCAYAINLLLAFVLVKASHHA